MRISIVCTIDRETGGKGLLYINIGFFWVYIDYSWVDYCNLSFDDIGGTATESMYTV